MRYSLQQGVVRKIKNGIINTTLSAVLLVSGLGGSLPLFLTQKAAAATGSTTEITNVTELCNAIKNQGDNQVWNIHAGTYALPVCNDISAGGQTGWYFPITANNLTINGAGAGLTTIYGSDFSQNGNWSAQDFIAIFGDNVTINGMTLMSKVETNKAVEVMGNNSTIENVAIEHNSKVAASQYDQPMHSLTTAEAKQWNGSIYYNDDGSTKGGDNVTNQTTQTLTNVTLENGGVSVHAPNATINVTNVTLNYTSDIDWLNDYRFYVPYSSTHVSGTPAYVYHVNSTLNNFDSVLVGIADTSIVGNSTIELDSNLTTTKQITLDAPVTLNGNGHILSANFNKTGQNNDATVGINTDNATINNLIVDGTNHGVHGIDAYDANGINLNDVTVRNNGHSGINVVSSDVTVNNIATQSNGWHGIDVDLSSGTVSNTSAKLTVNGTSHHSGEVGGDIYIDDTTKSVSVVDTNSQYGHIEPVVSAHDRVYFLKPATPTQVNPANNSYVNTNDFYFTWSDTSNGSPVTYEFQSSQSGHTTNGVLDTGVWNNIANGNSEQNHLTQPKIHSTGAPDGTWYWQVRTVAANGITGDWSPVWNVTIDTHNPAAPANLSWKTSTNVIVPNNGYTKVSDGTASWQDSSSDVDHYVYKYWNNITGNQYKVGSEYKTNVNGTSLPGVFNQGEGVHHFCVEAVDHAGNTSTCTEFTITYDVTAPEAAITSATQASQNTVTFDGYVNDDNFNYYYCWLTAKGSSSEIANTRGANCVTTWAKSLQKNGNPATSTDQGDGSLASPVKLGDFDVTGLASGDYTVHLVAVDRATNTSTEATFDVTVDHSGPTITDNFNVTMTTGDKMTLTPTVTDANGVTYKWAVSDKLLLNNPQDTLDGSSLQIGPSPKGSYTVTLTMTDHLGNSSTSTYNVTISTPANANSVTTQGLVGGRGGGNAGNNLTTADTAASGVLGAQTDESNAKSDVKGDTVELTTDTNKDTSKDSSNFLGLGWWWLLVLGALAAFLLFLFRRSDSDNKEA